MIRSYWKLHFDEQYNGKKDYRFNEGMSWYRSDESFVYMHRILYQMKALVFDIWACVPPREKSYYKGMIGATRELDYFTAYTRLREPNKLEDKTNCKLQVPRQGEMVEANELYKIGVDELLIKIAESEGLRVDARVLDQGTK
ncbi:hypothetical protein BHE74_00028532 [Ensete ventricosum]|nr:hypothetical protein BHE74_00028532 [Ensete ventricosum]RZS10653.1 hypothetical protein BHM03_00041933 [Ensete ventricosum]